MKKFKKGLTARLKCGSLSELPLKESKRQLKLLRRKYLTRASESGNLKKLHLIQNGPRVKKLLKKVLDKRNEVLYNGNVPPESGVHLVN